MQQELVRLATADSLTGVFNRRAFFERACDACVRAKAGTALSVILFDIDHFKRVNDLYGHDMGDRAICAVAQAAAAESTLVARLGGEEFAMLIEGRDPKETFAVAERLRGKMSSLQFDTNHGLLAITASFGVSAWEAGDTIEMMLKRADVALYAAKTGGRNCVVAADANRPIPDLAPPGSRLRAVAPEARLVSSACPTVSPATSVMRLRSTSPPKPLNSLPFRRRLQRCVRTLNINRICILADQE